MNALIDELNELNGKLKLAELQAVQHEQEARKCRQEMGELKLRRSEIQANINDSKVVSSIQSAGAAAQDAQLAAEAAKHEVETTLVTLKTKETEVDALLVKLKTALSEKIPRED